MATPRFSFRGKSENAADGPFSELFTDELETSAPSLLRNAFDEPVLDVSEEESDLELRLAPKVSKEKPDNVGSGSPNKAATSRATPR